MIVYKNALFFDSQEFPFYAGNYMVNSSENIPLHSHEFVECVVVLEGQGNHIYQNNILHIEEGDVFIIPPNVEHSYEVEESNHLYVCNILFLPSLLKYELESLSEFNSFIGFFFIEPFLRNTLNFSPHLKLNGYELLEIKSITNRLIYESKEKKQGYQIITKIRMIELFIFLSRCYESNEPLKQIGSDSKIIQYICDFIMEHYDRNLSLEQVSQLCGMSKTAFSVKFKEKVGKTFVEYRNYTRIKKAVDLLRNTDDSIHNISMEVGFNDLSFFNKLFKKIEGKTPKEYRDKRVRL